MIIPRKFVALAVLFSAFALAVATGNEYQDNGSGRDHHGPGGGDHGGGPEGYNKENHGENNPGRDHPGSNHPGSNNSGSQTGPGGNSKENHGGNNPGGNHPGSHNPGSQTGPQNPGPSQRAKRQVVRRALETLSPTDIANEICPGNLHGCPVAAAGSLSSLPSTLSDWVTGGFECVDLQADLHACGGCPSLDAKHDCTLIPGAKDVACVSGVCVVNSCRPSYTVDADKNSCIPY